MNIIDTKIVPSINYHLWKSCNANCGFCFATFNDSKEFFPKGYLSEEDSLQIIDQIISAGFKKITFSGGEPTLCKWLPKLIRRAKSGGLTTMIVTNGLMLPNDYLRKLRGYLDWVAISIDSINPHTNKASGRCSRHLVPDEEFYRRVISRVQNNGIKLKINTVVSKTNYLEELDKFILSVKPDRWKVFQFLPVEGQNSHNISKFIIDKTQFELFKNNHKYLQLNSIKLVFEENDHMIESYAMIDPKGRFYSNFGNIYSYSSPILEVGINRAYLQTQISLEKFTKREGFYNWETTEFIDDLNNKNITPRFKSIPIIST